MPLRRILHLDMDAFYASVEQRDDPALKGKPVAVGGGHRGVVAAASYEARKFGVRSAMPSVTAKRRCPGLVFVKPRFDVYRAVSNQVRDIFAAYTELIEPLSLDEAYLDVTEDRLGLGSARAIAEDIRRRFAGRPVTTGQIAIFGRLGSRPLSRDEMARFFTDAWGRPYRVTDAPDMQAWLGPRIAPRSMAGR